ncbi:MAG: lipid-A-disaccharide synthase [Paracoccaceae bacterium]
MTLYLIAGEPSGDRLGAELMRALRAEAPGVRFAGVGGRMMAGEGLASLFDIIDLNVMGLVEVVPRLRMLMRRIGETAADVVRQAPDALITIDSPSFGLRVAERVRGRAPGIRTIHYVAPSVWAWRPGRARHMGRFVDHVLALLPFEPPYMTAGGMSCDFVGHPVAGRPAPPEAQVAAFRAHAGVAQGQPLLLLAPGSRVGEVRRMMPVFAGTLARVAARRPDLRVALPVAETVAAEVTEAAAGLAPAPVLVLPDEGEAAKRAAFAAADLALVTSGTVTLEMAAAATPMVSAYRTSWLTGEIVRRMVRVDSANLVNLVGGDAVVPEFLQENCTADRISPALLALIGEGPARTAQLAAFGRVMAAMGQDGAPPPVRAARTVLEALGRPPACPGAPDPHPVPPASRGEDASG